MFEIPLKEKWYAAGKRTAPTLRERSEECNWVAASHVNGVSGSRIIGSYKKTH